MSTITIVGSEHRVVDGEGLKIDELAGNVATNSDQISIAFVSAAAGSKEPWLTLHYDEWMCVRKGKVVLERGGDLSNIEVESGQTVHIPPGIRFRPSFPVDTEYIPVCLPAFRPDRCVREDETEEDQQVAKKLGELHSAPSSSTAADPSSADPIEKPEVLYHMTTVREWRAAQEEGVYYPQTFEVDGHYTHATGVPSRLITTANHFYQSCDGDWVCLRFTRNSLRRNGIFVKDEQALPVGDTAVSESWGEWVCPHVIGGIPVAVVDAEFPMTRDGVTFVGIDGLC